MKTGRLNINSFTEKLDSLLQLCGRLREENRHLRQQIEQLSAEKIRLGKKNHLSESRINGMVSRLKNLEVEL